MEGLLRVDAVGRDNDVAVYDLRVSPANQRRVLRDHLDAQRPDALNFVIPSAGDMTIRLALGVNLPDVFTDSTIVTVH